MITYACKEIIRAPGFSWVTRFHTFVDVTINDLEDKVSYLFYTICQGRAKLMADLAGS